MKSRKSNERFPTGMSLLRYELKGSTVFFVLGMILSAVVALADLVSPRVVSCVIDYILGSEPLPRTGIEPDVIRWLGGAERIRNELYITALFVIGIALVGALSRYTQKLLNSIGAERLVRRMRNTLFSRVDRLSVPWYGQNSTGDILQRCTSDVETVKNFVSNQLTSFVRIVLLIGLSLYFMVRIDPMLSLIAGAFIPVIVIASLIFHRKIGEIFMQADIQEGKVSATVQENLTGIRVIRAFGKEEREYRQFVEKNDVYTKMWIRIMRMLSVFWQVTDIISGLQVMLVVILGTVFCVDGGLTAGNYVAFISYNAMLVWPVRELGRTIADLSRAGVSIERIRYIMNSKAEELSRGSRDFGTQEHPLIQFSDVSYSYTGDSEVLKHIDLYVDKGEKVGIIGGTGSGKSTITDLIMRMCDESGLKGTVTYRGRNISEYAPAEYRKRFARILQEPFLFSGTIAENIRISDSGITDEQVREAARDAELLPTVEKFTDGLGTFVGERGVTLSGGQKQRTAIAAALAADREVLLFDDAFSALDAQTEAAVRKNIFGKLAGRTAVIISHRINTVAGCDRIYVLDKGEIADVGTHSELISRKGIYRDIYELQTRG